MTNAGLLKRQGLRVGGEPRPSHVPETSPGGRSTPPASTQVASTGQVPAAAAISQADIDESKAAARLEGLALGRKQGLEEQAALIRAKLAEMDAVLKSVAGAWNDERAAMQTALADFAFVATNRMLGDCLRDPAVAMAAVRASLAACHAWQELTLEVHPRDAELVRDALERDPSQGARSMSIVGSESIGVGGCRIVSTQGSLDARLEVQLEQLRARLDIGRFDWKRAA